MLAVRDCDHVRLFGHGGNAKALPGQALYVVRQTPNFLLANGVDGLTKIGSRSLSHPIGSTDPSQWHMLIDEPEDGTRLKLPPGERPVLYLRGQPTDGADVHLGAPTNRVAKTEARGTINRELQRAAEGRPWGGTDPGVAIAMMTLNVKQNRKRRSERCRERP
jgi:hypothetical protein